MQSRWLLQHQLRHIFQWFTGDGRILASLLVIDCRYLKRPLKPSKIVLTVQLSPTRIILLTFGYNIFNYFSIQFTYHIFFFHFFQILLSNFEGLPKRLNRTCDNVSRKYAGVNIVLSDSSVEFIYGAFLHIYTSYV